MDGKLLRGDIKCRGILAKLAGQSLRYQRWGTPESKGVRGSCSTDSSGFLLKPHQIGPRQDFLEEGLGERDAWPKFG